MKICQTFIDIMFNKESVLTVNCEDLNGYTAKYKMNIIKSIYSYSNLFTC